FLFFIGHLSFFFSFSALGARLCREVRSSGFSLLRRRAASRLRSKPGTNDFLGLFLVAAGLLGVHLCSSVVSFCRLPYFRKRLFGFGCQPVQVPLELCGQLMHLQRHCPLSGLARVIDGSSSVAGAFIRNGEQLQAGRCFIVLHFDRFGQVGDRFAESACPSEAAAQEVLGLPVSRVAFQGEPVIPLRLLRAPYLLQRQA